MNPNQYAQFRGIRRFGAEPLIAFAAFLILVALMGGGARSDVGSLLFLRPLTILIIGYALFRLSMREARSITIPLALLGGAMVLILLQLVPLPPELWTALPGRGQFAHVYQQFGMETGWRPLSLYPGQSWNSLFAMTVPLAALLLLSRTDARDRPSVLLLFIAIAVAGAILGILQILGPSRNPFYLYRITNFGDPVGLFANRNHHAVMLACALPMMAAYVSLPRPTHDKLAKLRLLLCSGGAAFLLASIVATGSRSGTLVAAIAILSCFALVPSPRWGSVLLARRWRVSAKWIAVGSVALALLLLFLISSRLTSLERFADLDGQTDIRFSALATNLEIARHFLPWGSGMGSFADIFAVFEPADLIDTKYLNHAHNDWVEIVIEGGLPAVILLVAAIGLIAGRAAPLVFAPLQPSITAIQARLGLVILILLGVASGFDYPVRTPMISVLMITAIYWLCRSDPAGRASA